MKIETKQTMPNNEKLKDKRETLGLTQSELAKILGTTGNTIARWERGEVQPQSWNMLWLALNALEVAKTAKAKPNLERLSNEVETIIARIEKSGAAVQIELERMKKAMNLG